MIDGSGAAPRTHVSILIEGERIVMIAPMPPDVPKSTREIDGRGLYVIPGLIDMHAHVLNHPWDEKGNIRPQWDRDAVLQSLQLMLSFGVTTIRDPGSETEAAVTLRATSPVGPTIFTAGRILNDSNFDTEPFIPVHDADAVRSEIDRQAAAGVDAIKVYASMKPELVKVAIEQAHQHNLPVLGHLQQTTWTEAAELGIDALEHAAPWSPAYVQQQFRDAYERNQDVFGRVFWLEHLDDAAIDRMIAAIRKHDVVVDPTLIAIATKFFGNDPRWTKNPTIALAPKLYTQGWAAGSFTASWTPEQYRAARTAWPRVLKLTKRMFDGGVTMTVGTDTPTPWIVPGASVHEEMVLLHDAGIANASILKMATSNAAKALRRENEFGTVKEGFRADLVVLERDPLADIRNTRAIRYVIKGGTLYEPQALRPRTHLTM